MKAGCKRKWLFYVIRGGGMIRTLIAGLGSLLWRIRGGLWKEKIPANKIYFALYVAIVVCLKQGWELERFANVAIATFVAHQLCSWGVYIGRLVAGGAIDPEKDKENPLIDEIILPLHITIKGQKYFLYEFPRWYGFAGTTITGLMITYLMGLAIGSFWFGFAGALMGVCYWLGSLLEKVYELGKSGWNWGEFIFGAWLGFILWGVL